MQKQHWEKDYDIKTGMTIHTLSLFVNQEQFDIKIYEYESQSDNLLIRIDMNNILQTSRYVTLQNTRTNDKNLHQKMLRAISQLITEKQKFLNDVANCIYDIDYNYSMAQIYNEFAKKSED